MPVRGGKIRRQKEMSTQARGLNDLNDQCGVGKEEAEQSTWEGLVKRR